MPAIEGLVLFPGAGGSKEHATLLALEDSLSPLPVNRREFSYRRQGKRVPPRAPNLVAELLEECQSIADEMGCRPDRLVYGGRSMGGRICSMAVAAGMPAAGLLLLSYPLHPPNKPDKLRVEHFADIKVPCLFVSGNNDPFGSPEEFNQHITNIDGRVEAEYLEGGRHDPKSRAHVTTILQTVNQWAKSVS
ncbi:MAG TPA: dienelactone hydrolase [Acidimicrobiaceae bacterium]|nr:dienelactone hydrolase [Acidimicrobiaceae bacterium]HAX05675.1 dienelactone hydrolase [Acidimicrobiaceae bacterium]|tara:strand:+ start:281 stop:853 length:573 start_codon:yes stop_codon:yes gene_type:complete